MSQKTKEFHRCTNMTRKNGRIQIECKLGLWAVEGRFMKEVIKEALYYFEQNRSDGEYSSIINTKSAIEIQQERMNLKIASK